MNIVHIGTTDNRGGAARASFRLHTGLRAAGHGSRMVVGWKVEASADTDGVMDRRGRRRLFRRAMALVDRGLSLQYTALPWGADFLAHPFLEGADVIHLHNLHGGFFPLRILPRLARRAPVVWSLYDMWAMTGHCAYAYDCERWKTGCGRCPRLGEMPAIHMDTSAMHWRIKRALYRETAPTIATGSAWMATMVKGSPLLERCDVHTIPYGTDPTVFRPVAKAQARNALRIPLDAHVILMFAVSEPRKGGGYLLDALERLSLDPPPWLLIVGDRLGRVPAGLPVRQMGFVDSDDVLNLCYGAADVFVLPTLAENFPLSILDASAAGIPSIAFDVGGVPDLVQHLETGYLVTERAVDGLVDGLRRLLTDDGLRRRLGDNARSAVEHENSIETYVRRFVALYGEVVSAKGSRA